MTADGPAFLVSPHCKTFIAGARGGYHYKPVGGIRSGLYDSKANKNRFAHIHDADQYANVGAGEWRPVLTCGNPGRVVTMQRAGSPFSRLEARVADAHEPVERSAPALPASR